MMLSQGQIQISTHNDDDWPYVEVTKRAVCFEFESVDEKKLVPDQYHGFQVSKGKVAS